MPAEITCAAGWADPHHLGDLPQPGDRRAWRAAPSGATAMTPRQLQAVVRGDRVGQPGYLTRLGAAPPGPGCAVQADLDQAAQLAPGGHRPAAERLDQPQPVDRVHHVGVPGHARGLVDLKLADEVPAQGQPGRRAFGGLGRRFLVSVLADVGEPERVREQTSERERLGHRDQRDLGRARPAAAQAAAILARTRREVRRELAPRGSRPVWSRLIMTHSQISPANRPVLPSRR